MELVRVLRCHMGCALRTLLPLQQTTLLAPLPSRAPRFCIDCWRCSELHLY